VIFGLASVIGLALSGANAAEHGNEVFLEATYLGAPTDWCPPDQGVPLVVKMDGPNIVESPEDWPRTVRVRRGTQSARITSNEETTVSLRQTRKFEFSTQIGRFSAELRTCQTPWSLTAVSGTWQLVGLDGSELSSGTVDTGLGRLHDVPLFGNTGGRSSAMFAKFGNATLFTPTRPQVTRTIKFPAKEGEEN
jgi:hypothetical protein